MTFSPQEHLRRTEEVARLWDDLNRTVRYGVNFENPIQGVKGLEEHTQVVLERRPEMVDRGYHRIPGIDGYSAWLRAFQVLDDDLTPANQRALDRASSVMGELRESFRYIDRNRTSGGIDHYTQQKMEQLRNTGEVYMLTGHRTHFNITRIRQMPDGGYSYTLYDSGHETRIVGSARDEEGQRRQLVNAVEERRINPGASIESIVRSDIDKLFSDSDSNDYRRARSTLDRAMGPIIRSEQEFAQRRGNCVTRGQRIMISDIVQDSTVTDRLRAFIIDDDVSAHDVRDQLRERADLLRRGEPIHRPRPTIEGSGIDGWSNYRSSAFGESLRHNTPFASNADTLEITPDMQRLETSLQRHGVAIEWGWKGDQAYAYIRQSDAGSVDNLRRADMARRTPAPQPSPITGSGQGWENYTSSAFGESMRYAQPFPVRGQEVTREMQGFEDRMQRAGITMEWGFKGNEAYAYVRRDDRASMQGIVRQETVRYADIAARTGDWSKYQSSVFGESLRYERPFASPRNGNETTPEMERFAREMQDRGVRTEWGQKGDSSYAYISRSDIDSIRNLGQHYERGGEVRATLPPTLAPDDILAPRAANDLEAASEFRYREGERAPLIEVADLNEDGSIRITRRPATPIEAAVRFPSMVDYVDHQWPGPREAVQFTPTTPDAGPRRAQASLDGILPVGDRGPQPGRIEVIEGATVRSIEPSAQRFELPLVAVASAAVAPTAANDPAPLYRPTNNVPEVAPIPANDVHAPTAADGERGAVGRLDSRGARGATIATAAVNSVAAMNALREGNVTEAVQYGGVVAQTVAMEAAQHEGVWAGAARIAQRVGIRGATAGVKAVTGKIPVVGAVVGAVVGVGEIGFEVWEMAHGRSNWQRLAGTSASAVVGVVGGIVGFGAGEVLQEGVHYGSAALFGQENAARHSGTVEVGLLAADLTSDAIQSSDPRRRRRNLMDIDGDGRVSAQDLTQVADQSFRFSPVGIVAQHIPGADLDGDGQVSLRDASEGVSRAGRAVRNAADVNRDGKVDGRDAARAARNVHDRADVNRDGRVDARDAARAVRNAADVNGDGKVDARDAARAARNVHNAADVNRDGKVDWRDAARAAGESLNNARVATDNVVGSVAAFCGFGRGRNQVERH